MFARTDSTAPSFVYSPKDYRDTIREYDRTKDKVNDLFEKVNRTFDTSELKQDIEKAKIKITENEKKIERLTSDRSQYARDIQLCDKKISSLSKQDIDNKYHDKCKSYAIAVKNRINDVLKNEQSSVLLKMNEYVQRYFKELYHGNLDLTIDENYNIQTFNSFNGERVTTKLSTGTNDIKNFAFVFGLEALAKDHINDSDEGDIEAGNEPYPLVLDGPFSHTDGKHIENMCRLMPQVANQVVIAISRKDWLITKNYLENRVGKIYEMKHVTEERSTISATENGEENV